MGRSPTDATEAEKQAAEWCADVATEAARDAPYPEATDDRGTDVVRPPGSDGQPDTESGDDTDATEATTVRRAIHAGVVGAAVVAMDCCGGPTGRMVGLEATDRYAEHARWDDGCHLLAGYTIGTTLAGEETDRATVVRRFVALTAAWELLEYGMSERPWDGSTTTRGAVIDTVADTVMGTVGAWIGATVHGAD